MVSKENKRESGKDNGFEALYSAIDMNGCNYETLELLTNLTTNIFRGTTEFDKFNTAEHVGIRAGGANLIWASVIACYARRSVTASENAGGSQDAFTINSLTDQLQEKLIEQYARALGVWFENSEQLITDMFGDKIAQGAEAKVYYRNGDPSVVKERASIYSTLEKALDAITLHNSLFHNTKMRVIGYTRDSDGLFRIILTQPYIKCLRLATKGEIDGITSSLGFADNRGGEGVNYINDRLYLEDLHPANVFIDAATSNVSCIDCIVKFR